MTDLVWVKYRDTWNSLDGKWEWQEFYKAFSDNDYVEYFHQAGSYNITYEWYIEDPPAEVVEERIRENLRLSKMYELNAGRLTSYLESRKNEKI